MLWIDVYKYLFENLLSIHLGLYQKWSCWIIWLVLFIIFWGTTRLFSAAVVLFYMPFPSFPHPCQHLFSSVAQLCLTLCDPMNLSRPGLPVHHQLPESTQTYVCWVGDAIQPSYLILCHPLLLLPSIFPSIRIFLNESALCIRWPKYWSFSFNISPSNEHPGLIFFWMDWLDLLAVQGTLKNLLQHHSSKASILRCSAFFIV